LQVGRIKDSCETESRKNARPSKLTQNSRTGVANILGLNFSEFIAWFLWRTIYLSKLPRFEKKVRVALDWTLDLFFSKDLVHFMILRSPTVSHYEHAEAEEQTTTADQEALTSLLSNSDKFLKADPFPFLLLTLIVFVFGPGYLSLDALFGRKLWHRAGAKPDR
jgi:hypothetical protein